MSKRGYFRADDESLLKGLQQGLPGTVRVVQDASGVGRQITVDAEPDDFPLLEEHAAAHGATFTSDDDEPIYRLPGPDSDLQ